MILAICEPTDEPAGWAVEGLRGQGLDVERVTPAELLFAKRWAFHQDSGRTGWTTCLSDGRELSSEDIHGALNRFTGAPSAWLDNVVPTDRAYAGEEWMAFLLAVLATIPGPVVNPPSPRFLAGPWHDPSVWAVLAYRAGLPLAESGKGDAEVARILCVTGRTFGSDISATIASACNVLARSVGCPLLEVRFDMARGNPRFASADPFADLRIGGEEGLDRLGRALDQAE